MAVEHLWIRMQLFLMFSRCCVIMESYIIRSLPFKLLCTTHSENPGHDIPDTGCMVFQVFPFWMPWPSVLHAEGSLDSPLFSLQTCPTVPEFQWLYFSELPSFDIPAYFYFFAQYVLSWILQYHLNFPGEMIGEKKSKRKKIIFSIQF